MVLLIAANVAFALQFALLVVDGAPLSLLVNRPHYAGAALYGQLAGDAGGMWGESGGSATDLALVR